MKKKQQKKQQGTGCSKHFCLDYSLAFVYPNILVSIPFQGVDEEKYQPKRRANLCMKMEPMIHWKPKSCFASGDWDSFERSKKHVSNVSSFTLSHSGTVSSNKHIQVACGIPTKYPIYIVYRCGSEII